MHSQLLMRVSRIRRNDTMHASAGPHARKREAHAGSTTPSLYLPPIAELDHIMGNFFAEYSEMDEEEKTIHRNFG